MTGLGAFLVILVVLVVHSLLPGPALLRRVAGFAVFDAKMASRPGPSFRRWLQNPEFKAALYHHHREGIERGAVMAVGLLIHDRRLKDVRRHFASRARARGCAES